MIATEVKTLALQSGTSADQIGETLSEVSRLVDVSAQEMVTITSNMQDLKAHNSTLAAAIEEQSAVIRDIASSINDTARQAGVVADGVLAVERICA